MIQRFPLLVIASCGLAAIALADEKPSELSARQLYFQSKTPPKSPIGATKAATPAPAKKADPKPADTPKPATSPTPAAAEAPRLGLRYSIHQYVSGRIQEVDVEKEFRSGESFGLGFRPNQDAFLYVVQQGSRGNWDVLFPYPGERNRIIAGQDILIPPGCAKQTTECFQFDNDPGTEKLFIVLSASPERDFDQLIDSVRGRGASPIAAPRNPGREPALASVSLPGSEVARMRQNFQLASRGIIRQTVRNTGGSGQGENAMYIVAASTTTSSSQARVIVDVTLKHR